MTITEALFSVIVAGGMIGFTWHWATFALFKTRFASILAKAFAVVYSALILFCIYSIY